MPMQPNQPQRPSPRPMPQGQGGQGGMRPMPQGRSQPAMAGAGVVRGGPPGMQQQRGQQGGGPQQQPGMDDGHVPQPGDADWLPDEPAMPLWLEVSFPWMVSFTLHLGMLLLVVFMFYIMGKDKGKNEGRDVVVPSAMSDLDDGRPPGAENPGVANDTTDPSQNLIPDVKDKDGWAEHESKDDKASAFAAAEGDVMTDIATRGTGGGLGKGGGIGTGDGGKLAPFGVGRGGGNGPGPKGMFGHGNMSAKRIVYVLDHSGSMIDTFDFLREEVKKSLGGLSPLQSFSVVMFSEKVDDVFPTDGAHLVNATPEVKRGLVNFVDNVRAAGKNDDLREPFSDGLKKAFAMNPQLIYFLTDGNFDPNVVEDVKKMNANKTVKINTIAFIKVSKEAEEALKTIAADSGGKFKFVTDKDLGGGEKK